jgi:hypothetical protein
LADPEIFPGSVRLINDLPSYLFLGLRTVATMQAMPLSLIVRLSVCVVIPPRRVHGFSPAILLIVVLQIALKTPLVAPHTRCCWMLPPTDG